MFSNKEKTGAFLDHLTYKYHVYYVFPTSLNHNVSVKRTETFAHFVHWYSPAHSIVPGMQ